MSLSLIVSENGIETTACCSIKVLLEEIENDRRAVFLNCLIQDGAINGGYCYTEFCSLQILTTNQEYKL